MQGTIKSYDRATKSGVVVTDDRAEVSIDDGSLADPSILFLRMGQRVRFDVEQGEAGDVARSLHLVTF